jgi:WD40 repeat protein
MRTALVWLSLLAFVASPALTKPRLDPKYEAPTTRLELVVQTGHTGSVLSLGQSENGKYVITGSDDGTAILWDRASG